MTSRLSAVAIALVLGSSIYADEPSTELTIGDLAPKLDAAHWVHAPGGKAARPIREFAKDRVYVVEFWATWCAPCKRTIPHLAEIQAKFADYQVKVIGVSSEKLDVVEKWMAEKNAEGMSWKDTMAYTVAVDPDSSVELDYMMPSGNGGIPTAFIVGKAGRIEWIGNPGKPEFEEALGAVVRDSWDRDAFKASWEEKMAPERKALQPHLKIAKARAAGDWKVVLAAIDERIAKEPNNIRLSAEKFEILLIDMNQPEKAYAFGRELLAASGGSGELYNELAWKVVDDAGVKTRDLDFALAAAERANEMTGGKDAAVLDTLARVWFEKGDLDRAIDVQKKAVENAEGGMAAELQATLAKYEAKRAGK